ncbi:Cathepsin_B [Hexamita inflata]|uniref:Cathepsin B n=1 Tax=Hexamita inflata TaxID=28002 RepID=A0AA86UNS2_9EUKA|nr:Cathepsin B [Hexamita inflata]
MSCWAMSAVGSFSDNRCIQGKDATRVTYSEQYEISCDHIDRGCEGGYLYFDVSFMKKKGVPTNKCVSYKSGKDGKTRACPTKCDDGSAIPAQFKIDKYENVCQGEEFIMAALTKGTVQTAFNVYSDFNYTNGIYHTSLDQLKVVMLLQQLDMAKKTVSSTGTFVTHGAPHGERRATSVLSVVRTNATLKKNASCRLSYDSFLNIQYQQYQVDCTIRCVTPYFIKQYLQIFTTLQIDSYDNFQKNPQKFIQAN